MPAGKTAYLAARVEDSLAASFRDICRMKHITPSNMLRVLIWQYVEDCGFAPDPMEVADSEGKESQKRKPGTRAKK